jgi:hypothetical protein
MAGAGRRFGAAAAGAGRCDREATGAYLEASSERNRALYERHGFELVEAVRLPRGGPPMWTMWREPRR